MRAKLGKVVLFAIVIYLLTMSIYNYNYERTANVQTNEIIKEDKEPTTNIIEPVESLIDEIPEEVYEEIEEIKNENKTPVEQESSVEDEGIEPESNNLGEFRLTAYCNCRKCCGKWAGGATASGVMPTVNHTIAVDTSVIPFGTEVVINGNTYTAEDTGSAIKGNRIDIYMSSHSEAMSFGVQYAEVFVVK